MVEFINVKNLNLDQMESTPTKIADKTAKQDAIYKLDIGMFYTDILYNILAFEILIDEI